MIVAIGGGEIRTGETRLIDEAVVRLAGKGRPRLLFVPTASGDSEDYIAAFRSVYGKALGCDVDVLHLHSRTYEPDSLEGIFFRSDLIYVGGGDTAAMLRLWAENGLGARLVQAHRRGSILVGLSAGALAWFDQGISDAVPGAPFGLLPGLGLLSGTFSPHHGERWPDPAFQRFLRGWEGCCLSLDDGCALVSGGGGRLSYLRSLAGATGWMLRCRGGEVRAEEALRPEEIVGCVDEMD